MLERSLSLRVHQGVIKHLKAKGVKPIDQRPWSVLPGRLPCLVGKVIPGHESNIIRLLEHVGCVNGSGTHAVVWTPPGSGRVNRATPCGGTFADLRWGYTVHSLDGMLVAFQRVIFVDMEAKPLSGDPTGDFRVVASYYVSSWSHLEAKPSSEIN